MKRVLVAAILVSILIAGMASAQSRGRGGVPELWHAFDSLAQRVAGLENGQLPNAGQRIEVLEEKVQQLETEMLELRLQSVEPINILNSIKSVPIETGVRVPNVGTGGIDGDVIHETEGSLILIMPSPFTLGDLVAGDVIGELVVVTEAVALPNSLENSFINCNVGEPLFGRDRSPNSTGVTRNYTHTKNATVNSQFQNWTSVPNGNMSCAPAATGSAIEFWNRTLPGFGRGGTLFNITDRLHRMMGTDHINGTSTRGWLHGITVWINRTGYAKNMTITVRGGVVSQNSSFIQNGVNVTTVTGIDEFLEPPINITMVLEEFVAKNEFVILAIEAPNGGHAVVLHSLSNTPNERGNFDAAVMDPATGQIIETEIEPDGEICIRYDESGNCEESRAILNILSISLIGD